MLIKTYIPDISMICYENLNHCNNVFYKNDIERNNFKLNELPTFICTYILALIYKFKY